MRTCNFRATGERPAPLPTKQFGAGAKKRNVVHTNQALDGALVDFSVDFETEEQTPNNIYDVLKNGVYSLKNTITKELNKKHALKFYVSLHVNFHQAINPTYLTEPPIVLNIDPVELLESTELDPLLDDTYGALLNSIDKFELRGSGWVLDQLLRIDLHVLEFDPLRASTYLPLPKWIEDKHAVVNILNKDDMCFLWTAIAGVYVEKNGKNLQRISQYKQWQHEFNMKGITMPMAIKDIPKFERQNDNISISVYGFEEQSQRDNIDDTIIDEGYIYPIKVSREKKIKHVDMLLIADNETNHYCWIKNFSRLIDSQYSANGHELAYCRFCLHGFKGKIMSNEITRIDDAKRRRDEHEEECFLLGGQKTIFPDDPIVKFSSMRKQVKAPFTVYADFESILQAVKDDQSMNKSRKYQHHQPCSYMYHVVSDVPGVEFEPRLYVGEDAADHFLASLLKDFNTSIKPLIENDVDMIYDDNARERFEAAMHCYICEKPLNRDDETIVRDHCHYTGRFRGAAHQGCNLNYKVEKERYKLPVLFHNLKGYDAHLIMQAVKRKHGKINIIPNNMERYISFTIGPLKFLDSMQFLHR